MSDDDEKAGGLGLDYDSDDKNDDDIAINSGAQSELIDLGGDDGSETQSKPKAAAKIPKLSKPN